MLSLHYKRASRLYFAEQRAMKTSSYVHFLLRPWSMAYAIVVISSNKTRVNPSKDATIYPKLSYTRQEFFSFFFFWKNLQLNQDWFSISRECDKILWKRWKSGYATNTQNDRFMIDRSVTLLFIRANEIRGGCKFKLIALKRHGPGNPWKKPAQKSG